MLHTQKEIVKQHYPHAEVHYLEHWNKDSKRFIRTYSVYKDGNLGAPSDAHSKRISSGQNEFEAWQSALIAIQKGYK